ncbi:hypothetical protein HBI56_221170 [Parastagonospora nodorum]|nr:hypothetical protein HBI09_214960 [Parastagonospora nodorum]KAH4335472.1 hypothetical protein HBH98_234130 [Parastagonospora nodorum]KAH5008393.1 hypothetical protein HBI75_214560 [Parastagonospora nodorum]KAH5179231.1 hypothetical protein HBH76_183650 [Parastagonospora nodorum]KAH5344981.1 hypothetical protein HBI49_218510 [Parastagonospora nodorum]
MSLHCTSSPLKVPLQLHCRMHVPLLKYEEDSHQQALRCVRPCFRTILSIHSRHESNPSSLAKTRTIRLIRFGVCAPAGSMGDSMQGGW